MVRKRRMRVLVDTSVPPAITRIAPVPEPPPRPASLPPPLRLLGTWRSNKEMTVARLPPREGVSQEDRANFADLFGKMTIRYTETHAHTELEGQTTVAPYDVVAHDQNSIVIRYHDQDEKTLHHYRFTDETYAFLTAWGFVEYFTRVPSELLPGDSCTAPVSPAAESPRH